jgi:hypothetical protein
VGGEDRIILARDAGGVRQMGEGLPAHELWVKQGLWQRILEALGEEEESLPGPSNN